MDRPPHSPGLALRHAIAGNQTIQMPGAPSPLAARLIERAGFPAAYLSGAALSAGLLGMPDVGLLTLTELAQQSGLIAQSVQIPVLVDADTGFGEATHVRRTVRDIERSGAAGLQLEDQEFPKRCGHLSGKSLESVDAMCAKIRAAVDARQDPQFVIVARTDARGVTSFEDAVLRARHYLNAGADWIFPEALKSYEEFGYFRDQIPAPLVANMTEFGQSPLLTKEQLSQLGYSVILYPVTLLRVAAKVMQQTLEHLSVHGSQQQLLPDMQTRAELYELLQYVPADDRRGSSTDEETRR